MICEDDVCCGTRTGPYTSTKRTRPATRIGRYLVFEGGAVVRMTLREWLACRLSRGTRVGVTFAETA